MEQQTAVLLRIPLALKEAVANLARMNRRSAAKQFQVLLENGVAPPSQITKQLPADPRP